MTIDTTPTGDDFYVRVEHITKKFGNFEALKGLSLGIRQGEFVLFLGPSGCGKTTFLRIIAGLETQTEGFIYQDGLEISALPPSERDFGIVFQSYALFPNLSVVDNIAYGLVSQRMKKDDIRTRVDELLHLIDLPGEGSKFPSQLSGGQQQRVAVARAIATSPGLLLLDEPLSALDAQVRIHLRAELKQLQRQLGITTIMVTHDQGEALTMADRIVVMNHGVIEQVGSPAEIYQSPASAFVADFIGKMNFLPGKVAGGSKVQAANLRLACNTEGFETDDDIRLAIRAEDIMLAESVGAAENCLSATLDDFEFNGAFCRATLSASELNGTKLVADFSTGQLRGRQFRTGDTLSIVLPHDLIRAFPVEIEG
jgi:iron(III) transport system ATP-binding protein